jgi:hypothetical protein
MYSWGQLRLLLQQFAGNGVTLDTIDEKINSRYSLILAKMDWHGLEVDGILQTTAAYRTGSVAVTEGSTAVTGIGTAWTSALSGRQFLVWFGEPYNVTILSPTSLTLDRPYEGVTSPGVGYWLGQMLYQLPDNCRNLKQIRSPWTGLEIPAMDELDFGRLEGSPLVDGPVQRYVPRPDGVNAQTGNPVQQIMLWPLPSWAKGYPITYEATGEGFDGDSTTDGPLPFVSDAALLAGCKASLCLEIPGKLNQAAGFEAEYQMHLNGMLHVETSKKPYPRVRMDAQYTRQNIQRVIRGLGDNTFRELG